MRIQESIVYFPKHQSIAASTNGYKGKTRIPSNTYMMIFAATPVCCPAFMYIASTSTLFCPTQKNQRSFMPRDLNIDFRQITYRVSYFQSRRFVNHPEENESAYGRLTYVHSLCNALCYLQLQIIGSSLRMCCHEHLK